MRKFVISSNDLGQRADKFVSKLAPNMPQSMIYKAFRNKRIKCNGKKCNFEYILNKGDVLDIYINDSFFEKEDYSFVKAPQNITVVYEDENILVADKPSGLLVHGDSSKNVDTLINRGLHYLYKKGLYLPENENSFVPACVNRIDRNTRGIVVIAKNFRTLQILGEKFKNREVSKYYICQVVGIPAQKKDTLIGYIAKDSNTNIVTISETNIKNTKKIITEYRVIKTEGKSSWLEVNLITGRSHQIRAHLSYIGHPIVGDKKYGYKGEVAGGQRLYSYKLVFDFVCDAEHLNYLSGKTLLVEDLFNKI